MSKLIMGIDPGKGGGIAVVDAETQELVDVVSMPDTLTDINDFVESYKESVSVYIETVHSMPKQGVASTFTFGMYYGYVKMAAVAHKIRSIDVLPTKWQQKLGVKTKKGESYSEHKSRLKGLAQQLFPKAKVTLKNADALLIAYYGMKDYAK